jgi:hypothetical protein
MLELSKKQLYPDNLPNNKANINNLKIKNKKRTSEQKGRRINSNRSKYIKINKKLPGYYYIYDKLNYFIKMYFYNKINKNKLIY